MSSLINAMDWLPQNFGGLQTHEKHELPNDYYTPGFIASMAAYLSYKGVGQDDFVVLSQGNQGYFSAMGLSKALWGNDDYQFSRKNVGLNYSLLTPLASQDAVDDATAQINGCLRRLGSEAAADYSQSPAFKELLHVVGELHDNVWSHGLSTGFSMAQRRSCGANSTDFYIEFALADCGLGFLEELRLAKTPGIQSDRDAIEWCVQKGNSSKLAAKADEWAQAVPDDFLGSTPFGAAPITVRSNGNHHQGLGLAKLVELAKTYDGDLYLASGNSVMHIHNGATRYRPLQVPWKGVAISLTIKESSFLAVKQPLEADDVDDIMRLLRG
ncbi:hypothetical protein [Pseudomonas fluorescens]|uniref:hypothetical protein n=1 Tax=Pseudomonas fluorescens TaxID=294 RepID=UPI00118745A3|nr:hypothetical protein [Pseudomonas fluorescens]